VGKRRGSAIDSREAQVTVAVYGRRYLERHCVNLVENTVELYEHFFTKHVVAGLGATAVGDLTGEDVETWFGGLKAGAPSTAAKAYQLLWQIMNSAVEDHMRMDNPCRIKAGGKESEEDRPGVSVLEVAALAEAMPANLQLAVLLACWTSLRRAEILGLRRRDIDVGLGILTIRQTKVITVKNNIVVKGPASPAGQRTLHIPPHPRRRHRRIRPRDRTFGLAAHIAFATSPLPVDELGGHGAELLVTFRVHRSTT
jgi:hypothetical protein